jgi:hypothetical protein
VWKMVECVNEMHGRLFGTPLKLLYGILERGLRTARLFLYDCQNIFVL